MINRAILALTASLALAPTVAPAEVPDAVLGELTIAAPDDTAFLAALADAVTFDPVNAADIVGQAKELRPDLAAQIDALVAEEITIAPAAGPVAALALGPLIAGGGAAAGVAVAAGGGGGGGGDDGATPPLDADATAPAPPPPEVAIDPETANQPGLVAINASHAYARGLTGDGVVVAVVDSGLDTTHPEFAGRIAAGGFDFVANTDQLTDPNGHGTFVAGIVAAAKDGVGVHGVAHNAQILPLRIANAAGGIVVSDATIAAATNAAVANGAAIANNSWATKFSQAGRIIDALPLASRSFYTSTRPAQVAAWLNAADAGMVHVWATGNDGLASPSIQAGAPLYFPELLGTWVAVASTDPGGAISSFSNRCGLAAAWCLAAPGRDIISTFNGAYGVGSGTSFAAPHVSGALAVLLELFPELPPEAVVARLLETANRVGIYADAATYGQGFLDLEAATRPVGDVVVLTGPTVSGPSFTLAGTRIDLGPAFGDGLTASLAGTRMAVFDDYNATFFVDLEPFVAIAGDTFDLDAAVTRFATRPEDGAVTFAGGELAMRFSRATGPERSVARLESLSFSTTVTTATDLHAGFNADPADILGFISAVDRALLAAPAAFTSPYLAFAGRGYAVGTRSSFGTASTVAAASFFGTGDQRVTGASDDTDNPAIASAAQWTFDSGPIQIGVQAGSLWEEGSVLGSDATGAFGFGGATSTSFGGAMANIALTNKVDLVASAFAGVSNVDPGDTSLFSDVTPIVSNAFSIGIVGRDVFADRDTFGAAVTQPLRVASGSAALSLATGRDRAGNLSFDRFDAGLAPSGREVDFEVFYERFVGNTVTRTTSVAASAMLRTDPGHVRDAPADGVFMARLRHRF